MTLEQAEKIVDLLNEDDHEAEVREDYSGRCMFGGTCVGIVAPTGLGTLIGFYAAKTGVDVNDLPDRIDSMGLDFIYY